jgi:hypothetical protein
MSSISIKGILIGAAVDFAVGTFLGILLLIAIVASQEVEAIDDLERIAESETFWAAGLVLAGIASIIAGYVAARVAGRGELINGTLSSFLSVAIVLCFLIASWSEGLGASDLFDLVSAPVLGLFGGFLRSWQTRGRHG